MKWILIKEQFPEYGDNEYILVSDGKEVWVAYGDKGEIWLVSETKENDHDIVDRLTHWCFLHNITKPGEEPTCSHDFGEGNIKVKGNVSITKKDGRLIIQG